LKPEMWQNVAKFKGAEYFRKALYIDIMVWKEPVANCKRCKAITSLLFSGVDVWSKSGFNGLFSKLKIQTFMLSI
jgi:hypothetical protein